MCQRTREILGRGCAEDRYLKIRALQCFGNCQTVVEIVSVSLCDLFEFEFQTNWLCIARDETNGRWSKKSVGANRRRSCSTGEVMVRTYQQETSWSSRAEAH